MPCPNLSLLLLPPCETERNQTQVAANTRGVALLQGLVSEYGIDVVSAYMGHIQVRVLLFMFLPVLLFMFLRRFWCCCCFIRTVGCGAPLLRLA